MVGLLLTAELLTWLLALLLTETDDLLLALDALETGLLLALDALEAGLLVAFDALEAGLLLTLEALEAGLLEPLALDAEETCPVVLPGVVVGVTGETGLVCVLVDSILVRV